MIEMHLGGCNKTIKTQEVQNELYTRFDATSGLAVLERAPLPKDVIALGVDGIRKIWHEKKMRG